MLCSSSAMMATGMDRASQFDLELARSRESAGRLLQSLAAQIRAVPAMQSAAQYWQEHSPTEIASVVNRAVRRNPVPAIAVALVAGFLLGRALEGRRRARFD
jgi:ElaB/YqjD/DUF883 family membrane-anchored ribosome-binding protein